MEITTNKQDKALVITISGSVDSTNASELAEALKAQTDKGEIYLVADLSNMEYISSAGLRALLGSMKEARQKGGDLCLAAVQDDVNRVLKLSGFMSIFKILPDTNSAIDALPA